jgi:hypothetical protein
MTDRERRAAQMSPAEIEKRSLAVSGCAGCFKWVLLFSFALALLAVVAK